MSCRRSQKVCSIKSIQLQLPGFMIHKQKQGQSETTHRRLRKQKRRQIQFVILLLFINCTTNVFLEWMTILIARLVLTHMLKKVHFVHFFHILYNSDCRCPNVSSWKYSSACAQRNLTNGSQNQHQNQNQSQSHKIVAIALTIATGIEINSLRSRYSISYITVLMNQAIGRARSYIAEKHWLQ
jgi:hypothetical protein